MPRCCGIRVVAPEYLSIGCWRLADLVALPNVRFARWVQVVGQIRFVREPDPFGPQTPNECDNYMNDLAQ